MTVNLCKIDNGNFYDVTEMVVSIDWKGDIHAAARTADIAVINAPYDAMMKILPVAVPGDFVNLVQGEEIFYGRIYGIEKTSENGTITWNCIDSLQYLLKSSAKYNFKNTTAEAITAQVCADFQFPVGFLAATGVIIPSMLCDGSSTIYDIIMGAYTKAYKLNGKLYQCLMQNRALTVIEKGILLDGGFVLSEDINITKSTYTESTDSIINKVKIYNQDGVQVGEVIDDPSASRYGVFQSTYDVEDGINPNTGATALFKGPVQSLQIEAIGDLNCIAGRGVTVKDTATGMTGLYWIKSDSHSFKDGVHTMSLELDFKNLMDEKEAQEETEGKVK